MVSLNAATPVSANIPQSASVEFLKINLTAANDGPVNVSSIILTATGLSDSTYIDDVTFYDNGVKVGTSKNINSDRVATFNFATPIYIAAGTTKTLTANAKIATNTGSYGLSIASASDITSTGASVSGSFPINGNLMSAVTSVIGSMTVTPAASSSVSTSFGEDDILLADFNLVAGNNENALVESIRLYNGGTNDDNIVSNLRLFIDGEEVATGVYADRYATFTLNHEIEKGQTASAEVRGDIGTGSASDSIKLYVKEVSDVVATGKTYGFSLSVSTTYSSTELIVASLSAGDFTIDMDKAAAPALDIKAEDDDVVFANIKMTSNGENAVLSAIAGANFYVYHSSSSAVTALLENAELVDLTTGGIYDLTVATSTGQKITLTLDDEIYFTKGETKTFALRADVVAGVAENTTFQVTLNGGMTIE
jgi:hypothetical protein